jgi:hypothetical protein
VENCGGRGCADDRHGIGVDQFQRSQRLKPQFFRTTYGTAEAVPYKDLTTEKKGLKPEFFALNVACEAVTHKDSLVFTQKFRIESLCGAAMRWF